MFLNNLNFFFFIHSFSYINMYNFLINFFFEFAKGIKLHEEVKESKKKKVDNNIA